MGGMRFLPRALSEGGGIFRHNQSEIQQTEPHRAVTNIKADK